ncbi:MAG: hypothetical protein HY073_04430 [Deltaproteobacteria bacterium]|nr:hypothetical protein [Deltaproteobacteria bacterium]
MKTICLYHAECTDGTAAAAVVKHKYKDAKLIPVKHGDPMPTGFSGKRVFIVDFSYPAEQLLQLKNQVAEFYWYDHHKTAIPIQEQLGFGIVDLQESGATLTWKQLFPKTKVPTVLQYVRDKDLWLWKLPHSRDISADLRETDHILDPSHKVWTHLLTKTSAKEWKSMVERGKRSRHLLQQRIEKAASRGFVVDLEGQKVFAVNWSEDTSELGEYIYKNLKYPIAAIFSYNGKGWIFSLRSNKIDVSELALKFAGGGHPGASGFRTPTIDWLIEKKK